MKESSRLKVLMMLIPANVLIFTLLTISFGSTNMYGRSSAFSGAGICSEKIGSALPVENSLKNSAGLSLIRIEPGIFIMGSDQGTWDKRPARNVTISQPFYISNDLVTIDQFRQFRAEAGYNEDHLPYITGISWYDAVEFCKWLTEKEGVVYRLPTEAEWEYVARQFAGSTGGKENRVEIMSGDILEWCHDWYGEYPEGDSVDPSGPRSGHSRVVRGGPLDRDSEFWGRPRIVAGDPLNRDSRAEFVTPTYRSSMAPGFMHYAYDRYNSFGQHNIGFRVVQAPFPQSVSYDNEPRYPMLGIKQTNRHLDAGPDPEKPYFRKRYILPAPPETRFYADRESIEAAGLHPGLREHNHSPALVVSGNGDLLYMAYTSYDEYEAGVVLIGSRLRFGAEEWDMPDLHTGFAGVNNSTPLLWNENGRLYLFFGSSGIDNAYPFHYKISDDNGATWSEVMFPYVKNEAKLEDWRRQPVSTVVRDLEGTMYVPTDGDNGATILWATDDNGQTWYDTHGRAYGRHTVYAMLKDGGILGVGGKSTDIDGFMPKSVSYDKGRTWSVSKTPFPSQYGRHRPSLVRLKSGRLFMTGDFHSRYADKLPDDVPDWGCYVALSDDEGQTWHIKQLYGAGKHRWEAKHLGDSARVTVGYSVASQGNDGLIHIATSINRQAIHFSMNEAWIMDMDADETDVNVLLASSASAIKDVSEYREYYPGGQVRVSWNGGVADDGRFLLHGTETWYYECGRKQREATYELGYKTGRETFWLGNGNRKWQWEYDNGGRDKWTQWWPNGKKRSISHWLNFRADGYAVRWDRSGNIISEVLFKDGEIQ